MGGVRFVLARSPSGSTVMVNAAEARGPPDTMRLPAPYLASISVWRSAADTSSSSDAEAVPPEGVKVHEVRPEPPSVNVQTSLVSPVEPSNGS